VPSDPPRAGEEVIAGLTQGIAWADLRAAATSGIPLAVGVDHKSARPGQFQAAPQSSLSSPNRPILEANIRSGRKHHT
jgi:hypothetical protein